MKILAINSSPRSGGQSKTELMLDHLIEGMREAGAEVEKVNLREKKIKNCVGCFTCWTKTPGQCIQKDDMTLEIFPKLQESDLVVNATPLYYHFMNAAMSKFRERTLPLIQPFFEQDDDGKTFHPLRNRVPGAVWLSVCGFPDESEFDALSDYLNRTLHKDAKIVAEIYRPSAEALTDLIIEKKANDVLDATKQAGRELVESMKISPETMERITQPLVDKELFTKMGNMFWKTCIDEGVTPKKFKEDDMVPRPDSLENFMLLFPFGLNRDAAGDGKVVLQFNFSGEVEDSCHFIIEKDNIDAKEGISENPELTIDTPFELWMDIITQKADGQKLFMEQKYKVNGDILLMMKLFKGGDDQ
ncbi:NAD(P)H-dependent oxidoreductase [Thermodesulfobacteriota bacterium]